MRAIAAMLCLWTGLAAAHGGYDFGGPGGHGPIGVMGEHVHARGEWMLSYRFMTMRMEGNRDGTDRVGADEVVAPSGGGFMVAPLDMDTDMHMFGAMYAASDRLTLTVMAPYLRKRMRHLTRAGERFTTRSEGWGDVRVGGLLQIVSAPTQSVHLNFSLSLPTGDIDERDDTPRCRAMGACPAQLPYPMQLGSGTVDPVLGVTWRGGEGPWTWGAQALATLRLGRNSHGYDLGERFDATFWGARRLTPAFSASARLYGNLVRDIDGRDEDLAVANTGFIPTAESDLRGGRRLGAGLGVNWAARGGILAGHRLALEALYPFYQDLDGPQLESDGMLLLGWQYSH